MRKSFWQANSFIIELGIAFLLTCVLGWMYLHSSTQGTYELMDYRQGDYLHLLALQFEKGELGMTSPMGGDWLAYNNHYYLYFGPFPILLWLLLKNIGIVTNFSTLTYIFSILNLFFFYALLLALSNLLQVKEKVARFIRLITFFLYGIGPLYFLSGRYFVYETAIAIGSTLLLLAVLIFLLYFSEKLKTVPSKGVTLFLCGVVCAGMFLTRLNLLLTILPILGGIVWLEYIKAKDERTIRLLRSWFYISIFLIPVTLGVWGMTTYNAVRFGNPLEFGIKYSIIGQDHAEVAERINNNKMTGLSYLALNTIQLVILRPFWVPQASSFINYNNRPDWLIGEYPRLVDNEFMSSLFFSSPLLVFMFYVLYAFKKHPKSRVLLLLTAGFLITAYFIGATSMAYARRYIQDYYAFLIVFMGIGMYYFWQDVLLKRSIVVKTIAIVLMLAIVGISTFIAVNLNCQFAFKEDLNRCLKLYNPKSTFKQLS